MKLLKEKFTAGILIILILATHLHANPYKEFNKSNLNSDLSYIKKYDGKYSFDVKLFGNNPLSKRLKLMLKDRYDFMKKTWVVETPIEIKGNIFKAWGCQEHNCSNTNFLIVINLKKNVIYVKIREDQKEVTYSEDGSTEVD